MKKGRFCPWNRGGLFRQRGGLPETRKKESPFFSPYFWTFTTYFAEGFPYTIIRTLSSLFFRDMHVRLEAIGLTSLFGIPWIVKFLWGPQVDRFSTKRRWMLWCQFLLVVMMFLAAVFVPFAWGVGAISVLFFIGAFIAATNDIAIDGFYMEALDKEGQARFVGYRVMAYRIAMMVGTGIIATIGTTVGWTAAFFCSGLTLGLFWLYNLVCLPKVEQPGHLFRDFYNSLLKAKKIAAAAALALALAGLKFLCRSRFYSDLGTSYPFFNVVGFPEWIGILLLAALLGVLVFRKRIWALVAGDPGSYYSQAFVTFMDRKRAPVILAFIILLRTGEFMLSSMVSPFFVDVGIKVHYGWISSIVGLPLSIAGAVLGGYCIAAFSLRRVIWPFLLLQNLTNVVYMVLALHLDPFVAANTGAGIATVPVGKMNLAFIAAVHGFDQFAGGLGTAVLMTFLMRICSARFKAAHYAIGSGLMNVSGLFSGVASGFLASWLGYGYFFGVSFLFSIPGMALVPFLPVDVYDEPEGRKDL